MDLGRSNVTGLSIINPLFILFAAYDYLYHCDTLFKDHNAPLFYPFVIITIINHVLVFLFDPSHGDFPLVANKYKAILSAWFYGSYHI